MSNTYYNQHFWLIGASAGIGEALARALVARGATVTLSARRQERLEELASELGDRSHPLALDVTDTERLAHCVATLQAERPVDVVIYLAAVYHPPSEGDITPGKLRQLIEINLTGAFNVAHAVKAMLASRPQGQLVLYGSAAAYRGLPNGQPYSATKAGILNMAESLRIEWQDEVCVQVVNSGFVDTNLTRMNNYTMPMLMGADEAAQALLRALPSRRFEIIFPHRFMWILKLLRLLPYPMFFYFSRKLC